MYEVCEDHISVFWLYFLFIHILTFWTYPVPSLRSGEQASQGLGLAFYCRQRTQENQLKGQLVCFHT